MAVTKKTVTPVTETKETVKAEPVKTTVEKVETAKEAVKKEETVKAAPVEKVAEKKAPAKKAAAKTEKAAPAKKAAAKKVEVKSTLHVQFDGKSYSDEELAKIAKDVWKYDLKQKAGDLTSIELYVKPEENMVYYVMNKEFTGSFFI